MSIKMGGLVRQHVHVCSRHETINFSRALTVSSKFIVRYMISSHKCLENWIELKRIFVGTLSSISYSRQTLLVAALFIFSFVVNITTSNDSLEAEWHSRKSVWRERKLLCWYRAQLSDLGHVTSELMISKLSTIVICEWSRPGLLKFSTDIWVEVTHLISLANMMPCSHSDLFFPLWNGWFIFLTQPIFFLA